AVSLDVVLRAPQRGLDLPHLRPVRAAARVPHGRRNPGARRARRLDAVCRRLHPGQGKWPRSVADPGCRAVQRGGRTRRARRDRRPAERAAHDDPTHPRAGATDRAEARHRALALRGARRRAVHAGDGGAWAPGGRAGAGRAALRPPQRAAERAAGSGRGQSVTAVTRSADGVVTGNTYDKYNSRSPVARLLMRGFERNLDDLFASAAPESLLDVGCGEGVLTHRWATEIAPRRVVGIDLDDPLIAAEWTLRQAPNLTYIAQRAEQLPFADNEFDLATAVEVLEHVPDPAHTLAEMARCAARHLLISVPREPLWRAVNMARGAAR